MLYTESEKLCQPIHGYKFVNSYLICKFSFSAAKIDKFPTKSILVYPPHLKYVAALPWETYNCICICTDTFLETLSTLPLTSEESISRHVSVQMVDMRNTFCEQTHANDLHFHVFLVQVSSAHGVRFVLC